MKKKKTETLKNKTNEGIMLSPEKGGGDLAKRKKKKEKD